MISGFVIARLLMERAQLGFGEFLLGFYSARLKRLVPVLLLVVVTTGIAISLFSPRPEPFLMTGAHAVFGLSNIHLYLQAQDYFARATALNPYTHTWSLGVEEQYYLLVPVLLWTVVRWRGARAFGWLLAGLAVLSGVAFAVLYPEDAPFAFYMMPTRFWQLAVGMLAYLAVTRMARRPDGPLARVTAVAGNSVLVLGLVGVALLPSAASGVGLSVLVTLIACAIVALVALAADRSSALLSSGALVHLGKLSYSVYLWHWPVIVLLRWTLGIGWATGIGAVVLTYVLSALSYRYVEMPLRYATWSNRRLTEIALALAASAVVAGGIVGQVKVLKWQAYLGEPVTDPNVGIWTLVNEYTSASGTVWRGLPCVLDSVEDVGGSFDLGQCIVGAPPEVADRRVLVMGNSFPAAMMAMYDQPVVDGKSYSFLVTSSWGAGYLPGMPNRGPLKEASEYYWSVLFDRFVGQLRKGDSLLLVNWFGRIPPKFGSSPEDLAMFRQSVIRLSDRLRAQGVNLIVFSAVPFLMESGCDPVSASPHWFSPEGAACGYQTREEAVTRIAPLSNVLHELAQDGHIRIVDAFDLFCPGPECGYFDGNGMLLYRGEYGHPSVYAAQAARPLLAEVLRDLP